MNALPRLVALVLTLVLLSACGSQSRKSRELESTLNAYRQAVRWGSLAQMEPFLDPEWLEQNPIDALTRQRFAQMRCSGYRELGPAVETDDGRMRLSVEIEYTNIHTQSPRVVPDTQLWAWKRGRWVLTSGLPRLTLQDG